MENLWLCFHASKDNMKCCSLTFIFCCIHANHLFPSVSTSFRNEIKAWSFHVFCSLSSKTNSLLRFFLWCVLVAELWTFSNHWNTLWGNIKWYTQDINTNPGFTGSRSSSTFAKTDWQHLFQTSQSRPPARSCCLCGVVEIMKTNLQSPSPSKIFMR